MNARHWITLVLAAAVLWGGWAVFRQHTLLGRLRNETAELEANHGRHRIFRLEEGGAGPLAPQTPELSEADKLELVRLRGEVTRLRQQVRDLGTVRSEHERLRASLGLTSLPGGAGAAGAGTGLDGAGAPFGAYLRRQDARYLGFGTPEAALQSFLWALEQQNAQVLLSVFGGERARQLREILESDDGEAHWEELRVLPGLRVLSSESPSPDERVFTAELVPGTAPMEMRWVRQGNEWKLEDL